MKGNWRSLPVIVILAIIWGSSFILMKRGMFAFDANGIQVPVFSPNQVAALRLGIASLVMLPFAFIFKSWLKRELIWWYVVVGMLGSGIPAFLFTNSQMFLHSSMSGILNALTPLFTLIVGYLVFKKSVRKMQIVGVTLGLIGAICLISLRGLGDSKNMAYSMLIVLATISYGFSVNTIHSKLHGVPSFAISAFSLLVIGIPCWILIATDGTLEILQTNTHGWRSFGFVATLAVLGTALGNILFFRFTQKVGALAASSITYLIPVVAILWGVYDGEPFTWLHGAFAGIILTGIYLVNKQPASRFTK